jgi:hypothetical protein
MEAERWLPVVGFEGLYEISEQGSVRTVRRFARTARGHRIVPARILSQELNHGYRRVSLSRHSRKNHYRVHVLVLEAFVGPRPDAHEGCHGDGNKANNVASNLRWGTGKENKADAFAHGVVPLGEQSPNAKLTNLQAAAIKTAPRGTKALALAYGVSTTTIKNIRAGRGWARALAETAAS